MPNITVIRSHLFETIGRQFTDKEFDELCFEFGVEVDDVEKQVIEVIIVLIDQNEYFPMTYLYFLVYWRWN